MMLEVDIRIPITRDGPEELRKRVAVRLGVREDDIGSMILLRRSIDARKKESMIYVVYRVAVDLRKEIPVPSGVKVYLEPEPFTVKRCRDFRVMVVGTGPAGLFCSLVLCMAGAKGVLIDRGCYVEERVKRVEALWSRGELDPGCNPQFGEGGAGTFSDGKLTTRVRDPRIRWIFEKLVEAGAPEDILYHAKPHVGTDIIRIVVKRMRKWIEESGWEVCFRTVLEDIETENGRLKRVFVNGEWVGFDAVVLAPGHSARDTYRMLIRRRVAVEPKPFAVGFRIEHPQELIDRAQYGRWAGHPNLPPATYQLAHTFKGTKRGVYTFCMCPGGYVICASSSHQRLVVNGMSYRSRDSGFANAAVVVTVDQRDFPEGVLGGLSFQEEIEEKAYKVAGNFVAPAQCVREFMGKSGSCKVVSTYRPGITHYPVGRLFPPELVEYLKRGLRIFGKKLKGFDAEGVIVAPETRTSSPVRILRKDNFESVSVEGLYPCGEGAGYAGGIVSSALDGVKVAEALIAKYS